MSQIDIKRISPNAESTRYSALSQMFRKMEANCRKLMDEVKGQNPALAYRLLGQAESLELVAFVMDGEAGSPHRSITMFEGNIINLYSSLQETLRFAMSVTLDTSKEKVEQPDEMDFTFSMRKPENE